MPSPAANKRKGSKWESDIVEGFRDLGFEAERLHLSGSHDEGDIAVRLHNGQILLVEAKDAAYSPGHLDEALVEREHYAKARRRPITEIFAAVFRRRRGKPGLTNTQVVISFPDYLELIAR